MSHATARVTFTNVYHAWNQAVLQLIKKLSTTTYRLSKEDAIAVGKNILKHCKSTSADGGQAASHEEAKNDLSALLLLANKDEAILDIEDNLGEDMRKTTAKRFPDDDQLLGNALKLSLLQKARSVPPTKRPFEYPPFQKAMPYFPDNGYQLTLMFAEKEITEQIKKKIIILLDQLTGLLQLLEMFQQPHNSCIVVSASYLHNNFNHIPVGFDYSVKVLIAISTFNE